MDWTMILDNLIVGILGTGTLTAGVAVALITSRRPTGNKREQEQELNTTPLPIAPQRPMAATDDTRELIRSLNEHMGRLDADLKDTREVLSHTRADLADTRRRLTDMEHSHRRVQQNFNRLHKRALHTITNWPVVRQSDTAPRLLDDIDTPE